MNRTGRPALVPALVLVLSGAAFGQLTDAIKRAPNPDNAAIQQHVDTAVKDLLVDDDTRQARGRDNLVAGASVGGEGQASPVFLDAYAAAVGKALTPLATHEDARVRLNAAIATARVAERAGNTRLADLAVRFMNDKNMAVALWGTKAARAMLPSALLQGGNNPLLPALAQAVQKSTIGPVVSEVYDALSLNVFTAKERPQPATIKLVVPEMLRVYRVRVDSYARNLPADAAVDSNAAEFLSFAPVWQQMSPQQRTEAVQAMSDVLNYAAQYAQLMEATDRQALIPLFKRTGAALQVIGDSMQNGALSAAAKEVQRVSTGMDGDDIVKRATAVTDALRQAFAGVKPAPKLELVDPGAEAGEPPPDAGGAAPDPANTGKAPARDGGAARDGGGAAPSRPAPGGTPAGTPRGPSKSAAPASPDDARTAGDDAAPAGEGTPEDATDRGVDAPAPGAEDQPAPRAPGRPPRPAR